MLSAKTMTVLLSPRLVLRSYASLSAPLQSRTELKRKGLLGVKQKKRAG